jgi:O-antigen/teichoic acid export membrane protein
VLAIAVLGQSLQAPTWIFYRRMDFVRQRVLQAVDPVTTFVVNVGLAAAGAGYWSLVVGMVVGAWTGGIVALRACPYRIGFRIEREAARSYFSFSWPLVVAGASGAVLAQGSVLAGIHTVGIVGVGAIALAGTIVAFSDGVDAIVTGTLYPAICAVRDRTDLLKEVFVKSNRVALMWGMPFGIGLALFAPDLVHFVLGDKWTSAIFVLQIFGVMAAADQIGFNWTAFLRALDYTRPLAVVAVCMAATFMVVTIPLLIVDGLHGYAIGMLITTGVGLGLRTFYLGRLFAGFQMFWHAARAITPTLPAAAVILAVRLFEPAQRTLGIAIGELALYVVVTAAATLILERSLLRELSGYLRREPVAT